MDAHELRAFRKSQKLSQTRAAALWGTTATSVWRWEHSHRAVPLWLTRAIEREKLFFRKIQERERKIAELLFRLDRETSPPSAVVEISGRSAALSGGRRAVRA
jgi:hypothetical protein